MIRPTRKRLWTKAVQAMGGEANLSKFKAANWKAKGTFFGFGEGVPYTGEWWIQGRNQFKMDIAGTFVLVVNGDQGWIVEGGNTRDMTKDELSEQKEGMFASWVVHSVPLKQPGFSLTIVGESKVEDRSAVGIKVSHAGHRDITL
jgi:hypothetical protein